MAAWANVFAFVVVFCHWPPRPSPPSWCRAIQLHGILLNGIVVVVHRLASRLLVIYFTSYILCCSMPTRMLYVRLVRKVFFFFFFFAIFFLLLLLLSSAKAKAAGQFSYKNEANEPTKQQTKTDTENNIANEVIIIINNRKFNLCVCVWHVFMSVCASVMPIFVSVVILHFLRWFHFWYTFSLTNFTRFTQILYNFNFFIHRLSRFSSLSFCIIFSFFLFSIRWMQNVLHLR